MLVLNLDANLPSGEKMHAGPLTFSPTGRMMISLASSGVRLWRELADGASAQYVLTRHWPRQAGFSCDGRYLLVVAGQQLLRMDLTTGEEVSGPADRNIRTWFDLSPVEPLILLERTPSSGTGTGLLSLHRTDDLTDAGRVWEREIISAERPPQFLTDNRFARFERRWSVERGRGEQFIAVHDTATGALVEQTAYTGDVNRLVLAPDARWLAFRRTNFIDMIPLAPGAGPAARVNNDGRRHFTEVAFHPSGKYLAATSNDTTVKIYDTITWRKAHTFTWDIGRMRSIAFSPDGTLVAAANDLGQVVVWDFDL